MSPSYGKVFSVNLGPSERMVVIADYEVLKEAFNNHVLASRPQMVLWFNEYFRYGNGYDSRGLLFSVASTYTGGNYIFTILLRD